MKLLDKMYTLRCLLTVILLDWLAWKSHCGNAIDNSSFNFTTTPMDDSYRRHFQNILKLPTNRSPLIVDLRRRALPSVPEGILEHKDTEALDLSDNRLTNLPRELANLKNLQYINLVDNRIRNISSVSIVNELPQLATLILSRNRLKSLKGLRTNSLLTLEADYCDIHGIDDIFPDSLPSLRSLNLTGNPLRTVRRLSSEKLTDLVLKNCELSELQSDAFEGLSNLRYLDLRSNKLRTMPDQIFSRNTLLIQLNLGGNTLTDVRSFWFFATLSLRRLDLSGNSISSIKPSIFSRLGGLFELNIAFNRLTTLPNLRTAATKINVTNNSIQNQQFWNLSEMTKLYRLDLSKNRLNGDCDEFSSASLRILDLAYNNMTRIKRNSFSEVPNLVNLNLKGNQLSEGIDPTIFEDNKILAQIDLSDNPWNCDCERLYPLYYYLARGQRTKTISLMCSHPEHARGNTWWNVCSTDWKKILTADERTESNKTWVIAISSAFGACLLLGTIIYIAYTFKRNRTGSS